MRANRKTRFSVGEVEKAMDGFSNKLPVQQYSARRGADVKKNFVLLYWPGPNWIAGQPLAEQPLHDHMKYMMTLNSDGIVLMGGPFEDGSGGLGIVEASDLAEVHDLVHYDPAIRSGTLTAEVFEWERIV